MNTGTTILPAVRVTSITSDLGFNSLLYSFISLFKLDSSPVGKSQISAMIESCCVTHNVS